MSQPCKYQRKSTVPEAGAALSTLLISPTHMDGTSPLQVDPTQEMRHVNKVRASVLLNTSQFYISRKMESSFSGK